MTNIELLKAVRRKPRGPTIALKKCGYPESPSKLGIVRALDSRFRWNDGSDAAFCHTREGGYPENITQLGLCR